MLWQLKTPCPSSGICGVARARNSKLPKAVHRDLLFVQWPTVIHQSSSENSVLLSPFFIHFKTFALACQACPTCTHSPSRALHAATFSYTILPRLYRTVLTAQLFNPKVQRGRFCTALQLAPGSTRIPLSGVHQERRSQSAQQSPCRPHFEAAAWN